MDPERWAQLEAATEEYVASPATQAQFAEAAAALLQVRMRVRAPMPALFDWLYDCPCVHQVWLW